MADFLIAKKRTSRVEAGFQKHPGDKGNWTGGIIGEGVLIGTNRGISAPTLCSYLGRTATEAEMRELTEETETLITKGGYWDIIRGDEIKEQDLANKIYDVAIKNGPGRAIILQQKSLGIKETGKMDDFTLNTLNS